MSFFFLVNLLVSPQLFKAVNLAYLLLLVQLSVELTGRVLPLGCKGLVLLRLLGPRVGR